MSRSLEDVAECLEALERLVGHLRPLNLEQRGRTREVEVARRVFRHATGAIKVMDVVGLIQVAEGVEVKLLGIGNGDRLPRLIHHGVAYAPVTDSAERLHRAVVHQRFREMPEAIVGMNAFAQKGHE